MLRPIIHFFVLASACFALTSWWPAGEAAHSAGPNALAREPLEISAERSSQLTDEWASRFGSAPSSREMQVLIANEFDEEILFREALRLGLNRSDPVVRQRLVQNMLFLEKETSREPGDEADLVRHALDLGMDRTDLVVRRRLVQRMQAVLEARAIEPTDDEIRSYVALNRRDFSSPTRYRIAYAFESSGASMPGDESEARWVDERHGENAIGRLLPYQGVFSLADIDQRFGAQVAERVVAMTPGEPVGPVPSARGQYWIRLDEVIPGRPADCGNDRPARGG